MSAVRRSALKTLTWLTQTLLALLSLLLAVPAVAEARPLASTSPVASTCPTRGRPERSEDGRLGGAGRAEAAGRARNGVGNQWDGNVPLHEWVERDADAVDEDFARAPRADDAIAAGEKAPKAMLSGRPANGPPSNAATTSSIAAASSEGTVEAPVTWLFEPESFAPLAKIVGGERFGIVTDHLGTPRGMFDSAGAEVWSADIDAYGDLRNVRGERSACPFRWPGQYEDGETGLYYNRWRYYDASGGEYGCQDPLKLNGGAAFYAYVRDPLSFTDPPGLAECGDGVLVRRGTSAESAARLEEQAGAAEKAGLAKNGVPYGHDVSVTTPEANARLSKDPGDASTEVDPIVRTRSEGA